MKRYLFYPVIFCLCMSNVASAVVIGSLTQPSREKTACFPAADTDNAMLGFAAFAQGTFLEDSTTSCIFNSYYPISGKLLLNGGLLNLSQNLYSDEKMLPLSGGMIDGNGLVVSYSPEIEIPNFPMLGSFANICFQKETALSVAANCTSLDVSYDDAFLAAGLETSSASELVIYALSPDSLPAPASLLPAGGKMGSTINCLRWHPSQNYLAVCCSNNAAGKEIRIYKKTGSGTFLKVSEIEIGVDATSCAWHPAGNDLIVGTNDPTKVLISYSFNQTTGALTQQAIITIPNVATISRKGLSFSPDGSYLAVGIPKTTGASALMVFFFAAGDLNLVAQSNVGATVEGVSFDPTGNFIAIALSGVTTKPVRVYKFDDAHNTLTLQTSTSETRSAYDVRWDPTGRFVLACYAGGAVGTAAALGTVQVYTYIHDVNIPNGVFSVPILLQAFYSMKKSTSTNHAAVCWQHDASHFFTSDVGKKIEDYELFRKNVAFKDCIIEISNDFNIVAPIEFYGKVRLSGTQGSQVRLFMQTYGRFIIKPGATLILENVHIEDCNQSNIACMNDMANLVLRDSKLCLTDNYTFSCGALTIEDSGEICCDADYHTFYYTTPKPLLVSDDTIFTIGSNTTFNYEPRNARNNLIMLDDRSSIIYLDDGSTLSITSTSGLLLTKGQVVCNGNVALYTELQDGGGGPIEEGFCLGTGIQDDNCSFALMPLAYVIVNGYFIENNAVVQDFSLGKFSTFQLDPGAYFKTYISIVNDQGLFRKSVDATITLASGATITPDPTEF